MENAVSTGWDHIDTLCAGDGMIPSSVMLLTGLPGAGKTTLAVQLADKIMGTGNVAMYNSCEESLYQLRRTVGRLNLKHGFKPSYHHYVGDILEHADKMRAEHKGKQFFLFVDSLQTIEVEREEGKRGRNASQGNQAVEATWEITAWAKKTFSIVVMIGQVTKDGVFAGRQEIKHALDMSCFLGQDKDKKSETYGQRVAEMDKNRFGSSGMYFPYEIGRNGITFSDC